ncbi:tRNA lysidine(34) synthetase TilS [Bacillus sp. FJAT-47783]|uniref:tRNA lysidine(34) synthetase TilS n=1 Tax=Bacillus sp. FJAT-47783 TaxID=2922712 RepID=UPI001FADA711|nr:tRNA lysidine(34) synthetase TilS [Bacillus sp. FJAT-47783]
MFEKVKKEISDRQLIEHHSTVVVGVSGGPDSLALLHILYCLRHTFSLHLVAAHVDHMFRGRQSEEEMDDVKKFCQSLGIRCVTKQIDVKAYAKKERLNKQAAARECRYAFFKEVMEEYDADVLALGHHGDDQVETILMKLVRGTVGKGLIGISKKRKFGRGYLVRPLLSVTKKEILTYCEKHGINPRFDPSNEQDMYTRNRFRKYILPFLKKENPQVHQHFQYFSEILEEDEQFLEELAIEKMNKVMERKTNFEVIMKVSEFKKLPPPLQRRVIHLILNYLSKGHHSPAFSAIHIESIKGMMYQPHPSSTMDFPLGFKAIKSYDKFTITNKPPKPIPYEFHLKIPGEITLPNGKKIICETFEGVPTYKDHHTFFLPLHLLNEPLTVRSRRAGDKIHVKGMNGSKKVKDIYIDKKVPKDEREVWPIIEDGKGNIIWIPLLKKSIFEVFDVTNQSYIVLQYKEQ